MTGVKATLKVILQANDTIVAESEDPALWQEVLLAINKVGDETNLSSLDTKGEGAQRGTVGESHSTELHRGHGGADVGQFARLLGIDAASVQGACSPSRVSPYLTLDMHCWNAMKDQTPPRGPGSLSPIAISATLLALWMQTAKLGNATQAEAQKVLGTINLRDANAARSIQGAEWLQARSGGVIVVNPARIKRAVAIAKAFCSQDWKTDLSWKGSGTE